jgi:hypothetical protein
VEAANQSLSEAESDIQRTLHWLEHESRVYWQGQIRRRTLALNLAKESLRAKISITRRDGTKPSAIEERKAVELAKAKLDHAVQKLERVKQYAKLFQREALTYRGAMQRFVNTVQVDAPDAAAHLDGLIDSLEQYIALEEASSEAPTLTGEQSPVSMKRPGPDEPDVSKRDPDAPGQTSESAAVDRSPPTEAHP